MVFSYFWVSWAINFLSDFDSLFFFLFVFLIKGLGWLNKLGRWIKQLIQAYHQYGVVSRPTL